MSHWLSRKGLKTAPIIVLEESAVKRSSVGLLLVQAVPVHASVRPTKAEQTLGFGELMGIRGQGPLTLTRKTEKDSDHSSKIGWYLGCADDTPYVKSVQAPYKTTWDHVEFHIEHHNITLRSSYISFQIV